MRIPTICLALLSAGALGTAPLAAARDEQQKPPATTRPPAPPPTAKPAPVPPTPSRPAAAAPPAAARPAPNSRGVLSVNGVFQPQKVSFTSTRDLTYFRETATETSDYDVDGGVGFDIGGFARVWRNLGLGVSLSQVSRSAEAAVSGRYPHPFFFSQLRTAETAADVDRTETGVHVSVAYLVPSSARFRVVVYGGPSFYRVKQDVVEDLSVTETYPFDTVAVAPGTRSELSESLVGFHAGADAAWYFSQRIGAGVLLRYAEATKSVAIGTGGTFDLKAGGFQAGLGLRVRF